MRYRCIFCTHGFRFLCAALQCMGLRSFTAGTQRLSKTLLAQVTFHYFLSPEPALCSMLLTTHSLSLTRSRKRQWRPPCRITGCLYTGSSCLQLAATASFSFWGNPAVPSSDKPMATGDCTLPCACGNPNETWHPVQWSRRAFGYMYCTFLFIPSAVLHSTYPLDDHCRSFPTQIFY